MPARNPAVEEDLSLLSQANNYREWLFSLVQPYLGKRILEIGSGIGNYSSYLLPADRIWLSDNDAGYLEALRRAFRAHRHVSCHHFDLARPNRHVLSELQREGMDTVLIMNVLEHIPNDGEALDLLGAHLIDGGRIVMLVPALAALYGSLDIAYGHFRRYSREDVKRLLRATGLSLERSRYTNLLAVPSWFWLSRIRRAERLPTRMVRFYDRLIVPLARWAERYVAPPLGSSRLVVLRKQGHAASH